MVQPPSFQELLFSTETITDSTDLVDALLLPHAIIWDPVVQILQSPGLNICPNENCDGLLELNAWTTGQNKATQPRLLHNTRYPVLLIGAIYKCSSNHHTIFSTDPRLLQRINSIEVPFILLHRTGFIREFIQCIVSLAEEGMSLQAIVRHIKTLRENLTADLLVKLKTTYDKFSGKSLDTLSLTTSPVVTWLTRQMPTNDLVSRCIIIHFLENESFYTSEMLRMQVKQTIRIDHTFKVASNIGFLRPDGKWVTQYGSVFLVLNDEGAVVTWQLTKTTSFDEVTLLLSHLRERISLPEGKRLTVYVDNCCTVRKKLQQIYGTNVVVKLDMFHAVQRVSRAMSKKHLLFHTCIHDFRMIFRDPTDICKKRTMSTPDAAEIMKNMDNFVVKWKNAEYNGRNILTDNVMEQLQSLCKHIRQGCLSGIEPSGGTGYNEALHRHINPYFSHAGRMGMSLALAILTIQIYRHNIKKGKQSHNSLERCITAVLGGVNQHTINRQFGIVEKEDGGVISNWFLRITDNTEQDGGECDLEEGPSLISVDDTDRLLRKAINSAEVATSMCHIIKNSDKFSYRMMPFMSMVPSLLFRSSGSTLQEHEKVHADRLSFILDACDMKKHVIEGDGDCLFSAVAFGIITNLHLLSESQKQLLKDSGVDPSLDTKNIAVQLRSVMVREWIENSSYYEGFLEDVCIEQEAPKFLAPGYFFGDLADTMVTALSNALKMPIVVFSSTACYPFLCITPKIQKVSVPVMITFTQFGSGHYDAIIPKDKTPSDPHKCTCGKNDHTESSHCHETKCKYTTVCRCPCLRANKACTDLCKCKNCSNPNGQKRFCETPKRKRFKHAWQEFKHVNSIQFAHSKSEKLSTGPFTKVEYFLLDSIVSYCNEEDIETEPESIHNIYERIVCSADPGNLPLSRKSVQEIKKFIDLHTKIIKTFEQLCQMQLDWNTSQETM